MACYGKILISLLAIALSASRLYGQQRVYEGIYRTGALNGYAQFSYTLNGGDTLLNGFFKINSSSLMQMMVNADQTFMHTGYMVNNRPQGVWRFNFGTFFIDTTQQVFLEGFTYPLKLNGENQKIAGRVANGLFEGLWQSTYEKIVAGSVTKTIYESEMSFINGKPVGTFKIADQQNALAGRFLDNGLPHDVWESFSRTDTETACSWHFNNGVLNKITQVAGADSTVYLMKPEPGALMRKIRFDEDFFRVIKIKCELSSPDTPKISTVINEQLAGAFESYTRASEVIESLGEDPPFQRFPISVPYYPIGNQRMSLLDTVATRYMQAQQEAEHMLQNTQLNILKLSDEDLSYKLAVVDEITRRYLTRLGTITSYHHDSLLVFINTDSLIDQLWQKEVLTDALEVSYEWEGSTKKRSYQFATDHFADGLTGISGIYIISKITHENILAIKKSLDQRLERYFFEEQLKALEDTILNNLSELNQVIDSLKKEANALTVNSLGHIQKKATEELAQYASMSTSEAKTNEAKVLIACFETLKKLSVQVNNISLQRNELQVRYEDNVWNPFTATDMTEQVKRRITDAYERVLLPHVYQQVDQDLSCENAAHVSKLIDAIHIRMFELRKEDTKKLERRLKNKADPLEVLQLMNISTENLETSGI